MVCVFSNGYVSIKSNQRCLCFRITDDGKATITLPNDRQLTIQVKNQAKKNSYIKSIKRNGASYSKSFITYEEVLKGGTIEIEMSSTPNKNWGKAPQDRPIAVDN
nr:glycoside hydrolase domain-containing protein [Sphingobacterium sp. IITKGP-BTPF85]